MMDSDIVYQISISENQLRELVLLLKRAAQPMVPFTRNETEFAKRAAETAMGEAQAALDMVLSLNGGIWEGKMREWLEQEGAW